MNNIPELLAQNKIGEGTFGVVYKSEYKNKKVAVKVIPLKKIRMYKMNTQLQREIQLMTNLDHQNIVKCYNSLTDQQHQFQYIILELCLCNLKEYMLENRVEFQSNTKLKIKISLQIFNALNCLKRNRIANRDIKMENILIQKVGKNIDDILVKLTDFGEARQFINACETRWNVGSPGYMSPEVQSQKLIKYDQDCDLWSVGVVIFQVFQGLDQNLKQLQQGQLAWPFKANLSLKHEYKKFYQQYINYPLFLSANIPRSFRKILNLLLQKQPEDRISLIQITEVLTDSKQQIFIDFSEQQITKYSDYFLVWHTQQKQLIALKLAQKQVKEQILGIFSNVICDLYKALKRRRKQLKYQVETKMLKETCIFFCKIYQKINFCIQELIKVHHWKQEDIAYLFPNQNPFSFSEIKKQYSKLPQQFKEISNNKILSIYHIKQFIRIYCAFREQKILNSINKYQLFK